MSWLRRTRRTGAPGSELSRSDVGAVRAHLEDFVASRRGVEAYVEPATRVTAPTVVLIAHDGEWTRRALPDRESAFGVARRLGIPVYDVNLTGYPARMREWTSRHRTD